MKKTLFLLLCVFSSGFIIAQGGTASIVGPTSVEVGVPYSFTTTFTPQYPTNSNGVTANVAIITQYSIQTNTNAIVGGTIPGYINTVNNTYFLDASYNSPHSRNITIQWSNGSTISTDYILVKYSGIYRNSLTGENIDYFNYVQKETPVTIQRLNAPVTVSGPTSIADCSQENVNFSLSNVSSVNGNKYLWSATGGTIVGADTGASVTVKPNFTGSVTATCQVRRNSANQNYFISGSKTVTRTTYTSSATITGNTTVCNTQTYTLAGLSAGETVTWALTNNDNEASIGATVGTSTTVTKTGGGSITLNAIITNSCGTQTVNKSKQLFAGAPPATFWRLGLQEDHRCDTRFHYVPIIFKIPAGVSLTFLNMTPSVTYLSQNVGFEEYLYTFNFDKGYSGNFDFFAKLTNSCNNSITDVYQEINIRSCAQMGLNLTTTTVSENTFIVYPNPAKEFVNVELAAKNVETLNINDISAELYDMMGMKKASIKLSNFAGKFDTGNLKKGIYILRVHNGESTESHQIIIE